MHPCGTCEMQLYASLYEVVSVRPSVAPAAFLVLFSNDKIISYIPMTTESDQEKSQKRHFSSFSKSGQTDGWTDGHFNRFSARLTGGFETGM